MDNGAKISNEIILLKELWVCTITQATIGYAQILDKSLCVTIGDQVVVDLEDLDAKESA